MRRAGVILVALAAIGCGKHVKRSPSSFANLAMVDARGIELRGWISGASVRSSTCTYTVEGRTLHVDIETVEYEGEPGSAGSGTVAVVQCRGPRLAEGHYRVAEASGDRTLAGRIDADGNGTLSMVPTSEIPP